MYRGSGRRVDTALDSPHAFKGCIMRSSPFPCLFISFFLFRNQVRLHSPHTAGAVNVCTSKRAVLTSPTEGVILDCSGCSSGGTSYDWSTYPLLEYSKTPGDARCMVFLVRLFCCCFMSSVAFSKKGTGLLIFVVLNRSDPRINSQ